MQYCNDVKCDNFDNCSKSLTIGKLLYLQQNNLQMSIFNRNNCKGFKEIDEAIIVLKDDNIATENKQPHKIKKLRKRKRK